MNYEDIWQIQDEITASVNSLGFSLWDLHYDRSSFAFHMELNEHLEIMVRYFQSMSESLNISHKSAALTFTSTIVIDNNFRASTFGAQQTIHNLSFYLNNALRMSPNPNVVRR